MLYPTHLALGLIIGKLTGNYPVALIVTFAVDLDHLYFCFKKRIFSPKKIWKLNTNPLNIYGNPRTFLHSFIVWFFISLLAIFINKTIGIIISLSYLGHLILDMIDGSNFYPFYPLKLRFKGPKIYATKKEFALALCLYLIFFII